ncbi:MAG: vitamin B12 dependent-methionine synthase activation domain-containing protein [Synergistaceae bacterium]|nr:vitamin B12 dependent-methionine synthase activation domain-containing protein [Synergistaceae bacterium]
MAELLPPPSVAAEIRRLLGVKGEADEELEEEIRESYAELRRSAASRSVYRIFDITVSGDEIEISPALRLRGAELAGLCRGCGRAALMAVTLGAETDRLIARRGVENLSRALILDACASAEAERLCDETELAIMAEAGEGKFLTMRFSPGYGGVAQSESAKIIEALDAGRKIGLRLTRSSMLTPMKSVTAVVGLADSPQNRRRDCVGCAAAESCPYRMRGACCGDKA